MQYKSKKNFKVRLKCSQIWVGYQTKDPPKSQTKQPLYQVQVKESVIHGRKPEPAVYRGLIKLQVTISFNKQKEERIKLISD